MKKMSMSEYVDIQKSREMTVKVNIKACYHRLVFDVEFRKGYRVRFYLWFRIRKNVRGKDSLVKIIKSC